MLPCKGAMPFTTTFYYAEGKGLCQVFQAGFAAIMKL